ncbi:MAG: SprT family zinc-dependent metalloprotease [Ahrensia sp.]|nr:SprT family zinc-dependent metalloprotease [Ahrensia sp.]
MIFGFFKQQPQKQVSGKQTFDVGGRSLPLTIVENERAKRLTLRIQPGARGLKITTPPDVPSREIDKFLERNHGWILSKLDLVPDKPMLREGVKIPIRGVNHLIVLQKGRGLTHTMMGEDGTAQLVVFGERSFLTRRIADYLKKEAKHEIEALVAHHTGKVGRKATSITFRDTTSRWGSCTSDGKLSFSWRIMMAPPSVINYLVAHEVAHLKEMNHSPRFWALCKELCPQTDTCKSWLKRNGNKLQAIGF